MSLQHLLRTVLCLAFPLAAHALPFSYRELIETTPTLSASAQSPSAGTGEVIINGLETRARSGPFSVAWGDGETTTGSFPLRHTYADRTRNYLARVTATYTDGSTSTVSVAVRFVASELGAYPARAELTVAFAAPPSATPTLPGFTIPAVTPFADDAYSKHPRATFERVTTAMAEIQRDLVNDDFLRVDGGFRQFIVTQPNLTSSFALWYSRPPIVVARNNALIDPAGWSTFAHEMGHNFTLNSPAAYRLGGKIDGPANAIVSEALAQIFQHVTCHLLVNNAASYGLPDDLAQDIADGARISFLNLKRNQATAPFTTWNDPATPADDALPSFYAIAWLFFAHADRDGADYRVATQRLMRRLQLWNSDWEQRYARMTNSPAAATFRATLMAAAVSHGVQKDLRADFRALGASIDDLLFTAISNGQSNFTHIITSPATADATVNAPFGYRITATGNPTRFEVSNLPAGLSLNPTTGEISGTPQAPATATVRLRALGPTTSGEIDLVLTIAAPAVSRLANLSVRANLLATERLIVGFAVQGGTKTVLVRAIAPGLLPFLGGGTAVAGDPQLELFDAAGALVATNDNWGGTRTLSDAFSSVGAFGLSADSRDAALLQAVSGSHSAHFVPSANGLGLFEVYDTGSAATPRLVNVSARYRVTADSSGAIVAGFVIAGTVPKQLLIRGVGPSLINFGVTGALPDPKLELFDDSPRKIADNDDWSSALAAQFTAVGAFALQPGSKDAALTTALNPGSYTVQLSSANGAGGSALIEVYELP